MVSEAALSLGLLALGLAGTSIYLNTKLLKKSAEKDRERIRQLENEYESFSGKPLTHRFPQDRNFLYTDFSAPLYIESLEKSINLKRIEKK